MENEMENEIFTDDDIKFAEDCPILGPEYKAARSFLDRFTASWQEEHLKPLADSITKQVADQIKDKLWDDMREYLIYDTESNVQGAICQMVNDTIKALLSGDKWAMERYPLAARYDADKIRAAIAKHIPDELAKARIADLEAEISNLKQSLAWHTQR